MVDYKKKYLKYKKKYTLFKKMFGGTDIVDAFQKSLIEDKSTKTENTENIENIEKKQVDKTVYEETNTNKTGNENLYRNSEKGHYEEHLNTYGKPIQRVEQIKPEDIQTDLPVQDNSLIDYKKEDEIDMLSLTKIGAGVAFIAGLITILVVH